MELYLIKLLQQKLFFLVFFCQCISLTFSPFIVYPFIILLYYFNVLQVLDIYVYLLSNLLIILIKLLSKRRRPYIKDSRIQNYDIWDLNPNMSFPSFHACMGTIVGSINGYYFLTSFMVGISRVILGVHHYSDVFITIFMTHYLLFWLYTLLSHIQINYY